MARIQQAFSSSFCCCCCSNESRKYLIQILQTVKLLSKLFQLYCCRAIIRKSKGADPAVSQQGGLRRRTRGWPAVPVLHLLLQLLQRLVQEGLPTYCVLRVCPLCFCSRADSLLLHPETSTLTSAGSRTGSAQAGVRVCASAQTELIQNLFSQENLTFH